MRASEAAPRPLQNRVTPFGEIIATPERGTFMGNRGGCLHDDHQRLRTRRWVSARWITCLLEFRGWHREVMTPGWYTELFFLDEATAFAAGHRPCAECRRADFNRFVAAWLEGNPQCGLSRAGGINPVDAVLHGERTGISRETVTSDALELLPPGSFIERRGADGAALLWNGQALLPWTPAGYGPPSTAAPDDEFTVLTPPSIVRAFSAGYSPGLHPSAAT